MEEQRKPRLSYVPLALAPLLWGYFALRGFSAMSDIAAQGVPGYPNSSQRNLYLHFPWGMVGVSLLLVVGVWWRGAWTRLAALLAGLLLLLLLPYLAIYRGGV